VSRGTKWRGSIGERESQPAVSPEPSMRAMGWSYGVTADRGIAGKPLPREVRWLGQHDEDPRDVDGNHSAIAGMLYVAQAGRNQPFSVQQQAGMNGRPAAENSPAAARD
jgi:hypothetical protein